MDAQPEFGFRDLFSHMMGEMSKAVSERHGETQPRRLTRIQASSMLLLSLAPRDGAELMLAGHMIMFDALIADAVHDGLRGEPDHSRHATRRDAVALNKAYIVNFDRFTECRKRVAEGIREAEEVEAVPTGPAPEAAVSEPAETPDHEPSQPEPIQTDAPQTDAPPSEPSAKAVRTPTLVEIIGCRLNPEAMEALDNADPERFARALGIKNPKPEYIAAAKIQMARFKTGAAGPQATGQRVANPSGGQTTGTADGGVGPPAPDSASSPANDSAAD